MDEKEKIGLLIKSLREKNNISQEKLAKDLDITRQTLIRWEKGKTEPSFSFIIKITRYFNLDINEFINLLEKESEMKEIRPKIKLDKDFFYKFYLAISIFVFLMIFFIGLIYLISQRKNLFFEFDTTESIVYSSFLIFSVILIIFFIFLLIFKKAFKRC